MIAGNVVRDAVGSPVNLKLEVWGVNGGAGVMITKVDVWVVGVRGVVLEGNNHSI